MNILHGTWIPYNDNGFIRPGAFYLWVETNVINKKKSGKDDIHPMHLPRADLVKFVDQVTGIKTEGRRTYLNDIVADKIFTLPSSDGMPLPSYDMMKYQGMQAPETCKFIQWQICCYQLLNPIKAINDIHFIALYSSDIQIGTDLLFWYHYTGSLKEIIIKDQYIPALKLRKPPATGKKKNKGFEIYPVWEIISEQYEAIIEKYLIHMPAVCLAGANIKRKQVRFYSKEDLLRHFSENMLHEIISRTPFSNQIDKQTAGTFINQCVNVGAGTAIVPIQSEKALDDYKKWLNWKNKFAVTSNDVGFNLCFKLTESENEKDAWFVSFIISSGQDPSLKLALSEYWELSKKKNKTIINQFGTDIEKSLLLNLGYAARMYPKIWDGLQTDKPVGIRLQTFEAYDFLKESAWVLEDSGYKVIVPAWWTPKGRKKAKIRLKTSIPAEKAATGYFSLNTILNYQYELSIGNQAVTEKEWSELIRAKSPLVKFRGQWMELDRDKMQEMLDFWQSHSRDNPEIGLMDMIKMSSTSEDDIDFEHDKAISDMLSGLYDKSRLEMVEQPANFNGTLRQYQIRGVSWLEYLQRLGLNPCLADDMGLGKTIQIIALMLRERQPHSKTEPTLLIAPTSVLGNWEKEVQKFAPQLKVLIHHGSKRVKQIDDFKAECEKYDMVISSFSLARRDEKLLSALKWKRIVVDEAQNIKNPKSSQTKAVLKLQAQHRVALTGTPIENRLLDLWSIFNFLSPGYLGTTGQFKNVFEVPIQKENDLTKSNILRKLVEPFILRRVKTDKEIIKDLPDKVEQKIYCNLTKEQASLYEAVVRDVEQQIEDSEGIQRKGLILSTLMKLKQICNHPMQFLQDDSEFTKERSHKLSRLSEMIEEVIESGESLLVFSQFREICDAIVGYIRKTFHYSTYYIHGGTSRTKREQMIDEFQDKETEPSVFVLSLKAGGVGITLTKATHVFHFDRWWNPAVEDQATDRVFRIGQKKNVFAHKFVTIGTLEERIDSMIEDKKRISSSIIGTDESWLTELDNEAFKKLISLNQSSIMETE
ncbi:MAG: DEAD/DEAH box helicase [Nitrospirae bacterium]|nr:DEAD/DEAH box helicase [Nitrospirota bacterium]